MFDWKYYKARCAEGCNGGDALKDMGEGAIKKYWLETGMNNDDIASPTFNCEYYVMQNEELHEELLDDEKKVMCFQAVKHFLTSGVFDGLGGSTFEGLVVTDGPDSKSAWKIAGNKCLNVWILKDDKAILQLGYFISNLEEHTNENEVSTRSGGYLENQISFNSSCAIGEFLYPIDNQKKESHSQGPKPNCHLMSILVGRV